MVYIATLFKPIKVQPDWKVQIAALIIDKAPVTISAEYLHFKDIFLKKSATVLLEHTEINIHAINLEDSKQPLYGSIYSLESVKLKTLKSYIKTNLANSFICLSKSPASALILFNKKLYGNFWLYIDYQRLNNITIKNQYLLPLAGESLNCLGYAK